MSLYDTVKSNVRSIVINSLSEYPTLRDNANSHVIFSHQEGTEPVGTYCSLYLLSLDQVGKTSATTRLSTEQDLEFSAPYEATVQVSFIGKDAPSICYSSYMRLANALLNREYSQGFNLSILDKTPIRRIPQKRDTKWVEICSFDLTFFFIGSFKQTVGAINQIVYEDSITSVTISIPPTITP